MQMLLKIKIFRYNIYGCIRNCVTTKQKWSKIFCRSITLSRDTIGQQFGLRYTFITVTALLLLLLPPPPPPPPPPPHTQTHYAFRHSRVIFRFMCRYWHCNVLLLFTKHKLICGRYIIRILALTKFSKKSMMKHNYVPSGLS